MNELYECTSEGYDCLQKRFDRVLFSSWPHVIPKGRVINRNIALSTEFTGISCNLAFPYKAPPESGFTETYIYIQPVSSFCLAKTDQICLTC